MITASEARELGRKKSEAENMVDRIGEYIIRVSKDGRNELIVDLYDDQYSHEEKKEIVDKLIYNDFKVKPARVDDYVRIIISW